MATPSKNRSMKKLGLFLFSALAGFGIGYLGPALIPGELTRSSFYALPFLFFLFFFCYLLQVALHEVGHLVFGWLTGYSFVSLRIGQLTLLKIDQEFKWARMNVPGTGGQCLMDPPPYNNGAFPFFLYNLGGILFNALSALLFLLLRDAQHSFLLNVFWVNLGLTGLFTAGTNAVPVKIGGIPTDGYNIQAIFRNQTVRRAFWLQLKGNALLSDGVEPQDLSLDDFQVVNPEDIVNPLVTSTQIFRYHHYLNKAEFQKARECLEILLPYLDRFIPIYQNEIKLEWMFLELIGENDPAVIDQLYDESFSRYLHSTENWLSHKRFLMAYEWFHQHNVLKALAYYQQLHDLTTSHPSLGEVKMELRLADWLKSHFF